MGMGSLVVGGVIQGTYEEHTTGCNLREIWEKKKSSKIK